MGSLLNDTGRGVQLAGVVVILMGAFAVGCAAAPPPAAQAPAAPAQPQAAQAPAAPAAKAAAPKPSEYVIGFVSPMTGAGAGWNKQVQPAAEMAAKEITARGDLGAPIRIAWQDSQNIAQVGVTATQKLIDVDKVPVILTTTSSVVLAQHPIAKEQKKLLLNVGAVSPQLRKLGSPLVSFMPTADVAAPALASMITDKIGVKDAALLQLDNDYGTDVSKAFVDAFEKKGAKVLAAEKYPNGSTDMRTQLIKLKGANAKALVVFGNQGENGYIVKQAREVGITAPIFSDTSMTTDDNFQVAGAAMNGVMGVRVAFNPEGTKESKDFTDAYRKAAPGQEPDVYTATAYDAINVVAKGFKAVGTDGDALYKYVVAVKDYVGAAGQTAIDQNGIITRPPTPFKIDAGKVVDYK